MRNNIATLKAKRDVALEKAVKKFETVSGEKRDHVHKWSWLEPRKTIFVQDGALNNSYEARVAAVPFYCEEQELWLVSIRWYSERRAQLVECRRCSTYFPPPSSTRKRHKTVRYSCSSTTHKSEVLENPKGRKLAAMKLPKMEPKIEQVEFNIPKKVKKPAKFQKKSSSLIGPSPQFSSFFKISFCHRSVTQTITTENSELPFFLFLKNDVKRIQPSFFKFNREESRGLSNGYMEIQYVINSDLCLALGDIKTDQEKYSIQNIFRMIKGGADNVIKVQIQVVDLRSFDDYGNEEELMDFEI